MTLFSLKSEIRNEALMSVSSACRRRAIAAHNATKPKDLTGNVHFQESLQTAISSNQKPIFLQFQEMPGCQTCTSYAANVLSPPLMAEFLDTFFTPVLINNNTGYASPEDLRVLQRFDEPHYNNPTCRILSSDGITVLGHLYGVYNLRGVFAFAVSVLVNFGMGALLDRLWVDALAATCGLRLLRNARNKEVTGFVDLALETATFSMDCYWVGEAAFSQIQGVMSTKPGWLQGVEVVQATYDSSVLQYEQLAKHALSLQGFGLVLETKQQEDFVRQNSDIAKARVRVRQDATPINFITNPSEVKHYLKTIDGGLYACLPLTQMQAVWLNGVLGRRGDINEISSVLSPVQRQLYSGLRVKQGVRVPTGPDSDQQLALHFEILEKTLSH